MDPTQPPLNITPQPVASPYADPNNPYQSPALANVIAALKGGVQGGANAAQQAAGSGGGVNAPPGQSSTPNYGQFGQQLGGGFVNVLQALGGSTPSFGGGNILSGDAYGGSAAAPLPGLSAADYG